MPKIVILGSCRYEPYEVLAVPNKIPKAWNTEKGYKIASEKFYPAINEADEVWVYAPDGIGEHTQRDIDYAEKQGKTIRFLKTEAFVAGLRDLRNDFPTHTIEFYESYPSQVKKEQDEWLKRLDVALEGAKEK